jgi:hypothetical protein
MRQLYSTWLAVGIGVILFMLALVFALMQNMP